MKLTKDRFLLIARSMTFPEELHKLPAVIEPQFSKGNVIAFHCTFHRGGAFLLNVKQLDQGFRSVNPLWELRAIVELTRAEYLQTIHDYVHTSQR